MSVSVDGHFLQPWLPARCTFCAAAIGHGHCCARCAESLPWNRPACPLCALPVPYPGACAACRATPSPLGSAWTAFRYAAPVDRLIQDLKFHGALRHAPLLAELMAQRLAQRPAPLPDVLIPVPLHWRRVVRRGYNQALEVGRRLAPVLGLTLAPQLATRARRTQEQTHLAAPDRRRNVQGAFTVTGVAGRRIALLDDVITTGATLAELVAACRAAGAAHVEAWAIARVV